MHQPVRKRIATGVILLTVLVLLLFSARNLFVRKYIDRKLEKIEEARRLSIHYDDIHMLGLSGIQIDGVSVIPLEADTFLQSRSFRIKLELSELFLFKISVKSIEAEGLNVSFIKNNNTSNFEFLYHGATAPEAPGLNGILHREQAKYLACSSNCFPITLPYET